MYPALCTIQVLAATLMWYAINNRAVSKRQMIFFKYCYLQRLQTNSTIPIYVYIDKISDKTRQELKKNN